MQGEYVALQVEVRGLSLVAQVALPNNARGLVDPTAVILTA